MIFSISPFLSFIGSHFFQNHIEIVQMDQEKESRARRILKTLLVQMNPVQESRAREYAISNTWICRVQLQPLSQGGGAH
jgi:hypothetical protein